MDLILRNCKLSNQADLKDIGIAGEKIVAVEDRIPVTAAQEIDARSRLTAPAFIDPHIHLDKTLITDVVRPNLPGLSRRPSRSSGRRRPGTPSRTSWNGPERPS